MQKIPCRYVYHFDMAKSFTIEGLSCEREQELFLDASVPAPLAIGSYVHDLPFIGTGWAQIVKRCDWLHSTQRFEIVIIDPDDFRETWELDTVREAKEYGWDPCGTLRDLLDGKGD